MIEISSTAELFPHSAFVNNGRISEVENRTVPLDGIETRDDEDGFRHLVGVVVPWAGQYQMPNGVTESFHRGAFTKTLAERAKTVPLYIEHATRDQLPVGMSTDWQNTNDGLVADFRMAPTSRAEEVLRLAQVGMVSGLSVGFIPIRNRSEMRGDRQHIVRLEARLDHVGFVQTPAYDEARVVAMRHFDPDDASAAPRLARRRAEFLT
jgi:HK97 family phage prohead protease